MMLNNLVKITKSIKIISIGNCMNRNAIKNLHYKYSYT